MCLRTFLNWINYNVLYFFSTGYQHRSMLSSRVYVVIRHCRIHIIFPFYSLHTFLSNDKKKDRIPSFLYVCQLKTISKGWYINFPFINFYTFFSSRFLFCFYFYFVCVHVRIDFGLSFTLPQSQAKWVNIHATTNRKLNETKF